MEAKYAWALGACGNGVGGYPEAWIIDYQAELPSLYPTRRAAHEASKKRSFPALWKVRPVRVKIVPVGGKDADK